MNRKFLEFDDKIITLEHIRDAYLDFVYSGVRLTVVYDDGYKTGWEANQYNDPQGDYAERIRKFYKELKGRLIDEESN